MEKIKVRIETTIIGISYVAKSKYLILYRINVTVKL